MGAIGRSAGLETGAGMWIIVIASWSLLSACHRALANGMRLFFGGRIVRSRFDCVFERGGRRNVVVFGEVNNSEVVVRGGQVAHGQELMAGPFEVAGRGIRQRQI